MANRMPPRARRPRPAASPFHQPAARTQRQAVSSIPSVASRAPELELRLDFDDRKDNQKSLDTPSNILKEAAVPQLDQGNFEQWHEAIDNMLITHGYFSMDLNDNHETAQRESARGLPWYTQAIEVAELIKPYINIDLLSRVNLARRNDANLLLPALHKICMTPFRFLDLPIKVRAQVIRHAVRSDNAITIYSNKPLPNFISRDSPPKVLPRPSVTKVSRQLREETMPIYLRTNAFIFEICDIRVLRFSILNVQPVARFARNLGSYLPHLRSVTVMYPPLRMQSQPKLVAQFITFTVDEESRIKMHFEGLESEQKKFKECERFKALATMASEKRLTGEMVAMALVTQGPMWEELGRVQSIQ